MKANYFKGDWKQHAGPIGILTFMFFWFFVLPFVVAR